MNLPALTRPCLILLVALCSQFSLPDANGQLRVPASQLPVIRLAIPTARTADNWYPYVIARREDRVWIRNTPINERPSRPMHVWGNTRRKILR